jgi:predicted double-glycine peptidase
MNYDQFNWYFDPIKSTPTVIDYNISQFKKLNNVVKDINIGCVGSSCCSSETTWDENTKKCISKIQSTKPLLADNSAQV